MTFPPFGCAKACLAACLFFLVTCFPNVAVADIVDLDEALRRTLSVAPELGAANARIRASEGAIDQANQGPLPELSLEAANFPAFRSNGRSDRLETTLSYEQRIERGGKREARLGVAQDETAASKVRRTVDVLDLFLAVENAWVEALSAEAELKLAKEKLEITRSISAELNSRVQAARDPLFIGARGAAEMNAARAEFEKAQEEAKARAAELASFWQTQLAFTLKTSAFTSLTIPSDRETANPDDEFYSAQSRAARARFELEQSNAAQDPTFSLGVRHFKQDRDVALVFGISVPLGGAGANRGNIEQARNNAIVTDQEAIAAANVRSRTLARLRSSLRASLAQAARIEAEVIPQAQRALDLARTGFKRGAFTYLDVIEAEKSLVEAKASLNAVRKQFHLDKAQVARLTAQHIDLVSAVESVQ